MILVSFSRFDRTRGAKDQIFRTTQSPQSAVTPRIVTLKITICIKTLKVQWLNSSQSVCSASTVALVGSL